MDFVIVIALVAIFDRLREYGDFQNWYANSQFAKWGWSWLDRPRGDKWKPLGKWTHPALYNFYHAGKNAVALTLFIYHVYFTSCWLFLIVDGFVWWIIQLAMEGEDNA